MKRIALLVVVVLALITQLPVQSDTITGPTTYSASVGAQATTAAILLSVEAPAVGKLKAVSFCVTGSSATAAVAVVVTVRRTTAASSGGTALTAEGTGTTSVSKLDSTDANFTGIARLNGTPGTPGATIWQGGFQAGVIASSQGPPMLCKSFQELIGKPLYVPAGVVNGYSINVSSHGAGGLASGSISTTFIVE